jgi:hypothetical protein
VLRLAGLFSVDSFAGGFVVQSFVAYWFHRRFGVDLAVLGSIFFGAQLLAGLSALAAARCAAAIGLLHTMVVTHLPSPARLAAALERRAWVLPGDTTGTRHGRGREPGESYGGMHDG